MRLFLGGNSVTYSPEDGLGNVHCPSCLDIIHILRVVHIAKVRCASPRGIWGGVCVAAGLGKAGSEDFGKS